MDVAPKKSGAVKWILIGCGIVGGLGILACAGCGLFAWAMYKKVQPIIEEGQAFLKLNPVVEQELGSDWQFQLDSKRTKLTDTTCDTTLDVQGSKKRGTIQIRFEKQGEFWRALDGKLFVDGKTIELQRGPPPTSSP